MWKSQNGEEFEVKWKRAFDEGDQKAQEVEDARRKVKFFFMRAVYLYEARYVSINFLKKIGSLDGVNILYEIVEPLEFALNPKHVNSDQFKLLLSLCGRPGTGKLMAPIPPTPIVKRTSKKQSH